MPNYFLKNNDASLIFRIEYQGSAGAYTISGITATGIDKLLPDGAALNGWEVPVEPRQLVVAQVLGTVAQATLAEYRTLVKSVVDTQWG